MFRIRVCSDVAESLDAISVDVSGFESSALSIPGADATCGVSDAFLVLVGLVTSGDAASVSVVVSGVTAGFASATAAFLFSAGGVGDFSSAGAAAFTPQVPSGPLRPPVFAIGLQGQRLRLLAADQRRQTFR